MDITEELPTLFGMADRPLSDYAEKVKFFEFEYCAECHGDAEDHYATIDLLGKRFYRCKFEAVCHVDNCTEHPKCKFCSRPITPLGETDKAVAYICLKCAKEPWGKEVS